MVERYLNLVKIEKVRELSEAGDYAGALKAAEGICTDKLKNPVDILTLAQMYKQNEEYDKAKKLLLRLYEKRASRRLLEELIEVSLLQKNADEAAAYFETYKRISGGDCLNYIYEYRIGRLQGKSYEELLPLLQTLKAEEYTEKYAYELAKVYHKLGRTEECLAECADIILWFGEGRYVERARALQAYYRGEISVDEINSKTVPQETFVQEDRTQEPEKTEEKEHQEAVPEPMWAPDESVLQEAAQEPLDEGTAEDVPAEEVRNEALPKETVTETAFEQLSFFTEEEPAPKKADAEPEREEEKEKKSMEPLCAELEKRLSASRLSLEEVLHNFMRIDSVKNQLVRSLNVIFTVRNNCICLIITGEKSCGKTTLGKNLAKLLYRLEYIRQPKAAAITGERFNTLDLEEKKAQLKDCCLIVEEAGKLTGEAALRLTNLVQNERLLSMVILEGSTKEMNRLLRENADLNPYFGNRIHLPKYNAKELLGFAVDYAEERDYTVEEGAKNALLQKMDYMTKTEQGGERLNQALCFVKAALEHAEERNRAAILTMAESGNFAEGDLLTLKSEDVR